MWSSSTAGSQLEQQHQYLRQHHDHDQHDDVQLFLRFEDVRPGPYFSQGGAFFLDFVSVVSTCPLDARDPCMPWLGTVWARMAGGWMHGPMWFQGASTCRAGGLLVLAALSSARSFGFRRSDAVEFKRA